MKVGEANALGSQLVENRCVDWPPITTDVTVAEIINKNENVGFSLQKGCCGKRQKESEFHPK